MDIRRLRVILVAVFGGLPLILLGTLEISEWVAGDHWSPQFPLVAEIIYRISLPLETSFIGVLTALVLSIVIHKRKLSLDSKTSLAELYILACISIPIFCYSSFLAWGFEFDNGGLPISLTQTLNAALCNVLIVFPASQLFAIALGFACAFAFSTLVFFFAKPK